MKFESLAPDLQSWFRDMLKRGTSPEATVKSLLAAGYQERYARDAVDAAFKAFPKPSAPPPVRRQRRCARQPTWRPLPRRR